MVCTGRTPNFSALSVLPETVPVQLRLIPSASGWATIPASWEKRSTFSTRTCSLKMADCRGKVTRCGGLLSLAHDRGWDLAQILFLDRVARTEAPQARAVELRNGSTLIF